MSFKEEFRLSNIGFGHDTPHVFARSQWRCPHWLYIGWRIIWVCQHTAWVVRSLQDHLDAYSQDHDPKWLIYLTNWSYAILFAQSLLHAGIVIYHTVKGQKEAEHFRDRTSWYHKLHWFLTTVAFDAAILVSILYWTLVFDGNLTNALSVMTHGVNSVYAVSDLLISATPYKLYHFIYTSIYGLIYLVFSIIYHVSGGTDPNGEKFIYEALDWSNTGFTAGLSVGVVLVAIPLAHLFMFGLTKLRVYIFESVNCCCSCCNPDEKARARSTMDIEMNVSGDKY